MKPFPCTLRCSPHFWWHPIQIWSNPALKLTIVMKDVNLGKLQSPVSPQQERQWWWNSHQNDAEEVQYDDVTVGCHMFVECNLEPHTWLKDRAETAWICRRGTVWQFWAPKRPIITQFQASLPSILSSNVDKSEQMMICTMCFYSGHRQPWLWLSKSSSPSKVYKGLFNWCKWRYVQYCLCGIKLCLCRGFVV